MKALYFDTETTGLRPEGFLLDGEFHPGKICQLAYLMEEDGNVVAKNYYFTVDAVEPSASLVTGLTVPLLRILSEGRVFADVADEVRLDFASADVVVAHNLAFDEGFMRAEYRRLEMTFDLYDKGFCTMRRFTSILKLPGRGGKYKFPSLAEFAHAYGVTDEEVHDHMRLFYGVEKEAHDARHDTVKMYLALDRACRQDITLAIAFGKTL